MPRARLSRFSSWRSVWISVSRNTGVDIDAAAHSRKPCFITVQLLALYIPLAVYRAIVTISPPPLPFTLPTPARSLRAVTPRENRLIVWTNGTFVAGMPTRSRLLVFLHFCRAVTLCYSFAEFVKKKFFIVIKIKINNAKAWSQL